MNNNTKLRKVMENQVKESLKESIVENMVQQSMYNIVKEAVIIEQAGRMHNAIHSSNREARECTYRSSILDKYSKYGR